MKKKQKILKLGPGLSALGDNNKHVIQAPGGEEKQGGKSIWINHDQIFPKFGKKKKIIAQQTLHRINSEKTFPRTSRSKHWDSKVQTRAGNTGAGTQRLAPPEDRRASQRAGKRTRTPSQQNGPLKWNENEHSSEKPQLGESVTNRQKMLTECFMLKKTDTRWKVKSTPKEGSTTEMMNTG